MRIGIFGGTFDPVHEAHVQLAKEAQRQLRLDKTYLVPTRPWQKTARASDEDRKKMLELALLPYQNLSIDSRELDRAGASYSIDTLYSYRRQYGEGAELFFLMGTDQWSNLKTWVQWEHFPDLANLVLFQRGGASAQSPYGNKFPVLSGESALHHDKPEGSILILSATLPPYSSTQIRKQLYGESTRNQRIEGLDESVRKYILDRGLYLPREGSIYV